MSSITILFDDTQTSEKKLFWKFNNLWLLFEKNEEILNF